MANKTPVISNEHVSEICKPCSTNCCKYLGLGSKGWECLKHSEFRATVDARCAAGQSNATADNCEGFMGEKDNSN